MDRTIDYANFKMNEKEIICDHHNTYALFLFFCRSMGRRTRKQRSDAGARSRFGLGFERGFWHRQSQL